MSFTPGSPEVGEARIPAIVSILQANIASLNTHLNRDVTAYMVASPFAALTSAMVTDGDLDAIWDPTTGILRVRVCDSDHHAGLSFEARREFIDRSDSEGLRHTFYTSIFVYFHPSAFRMKDTDKQAAIIQTAQLRVSGWLRAGVLNQVTNQEIQLTSTEYESDGDKLLDCMATMGQKGFFQRGFANDAVCEGIHFLHRGIIA